jgi:hypothetical protein
MASREWAEDDLSVAGRDAEVLEQGRGCVPQVVNLDVTQAVRRADAVERADQVPRLDRAACLGGEDHSVVLPGTAQLSTVGSLGLPSEVEHRVCDRQQREVSTARCCLDRVDLQLAPHPLDLLTDAEFPVVFVDVVPAQPKNLTTAQAVEQQQHERRVERIAPSSVEEGAGFGRALDGLGERVSAASSLVRVVSQIIQITLIPDFADPPGHRLLHH